MRDTQNIFIEFHRIKIERWQHLLQEVSVKKVSTKLILSIKKTVEKNSRNQKKDRQKTNKKDRQGKYRNSKYFR